LITTQEVDPVPAEQLNSAASAGRVDAARPNRIKADNDSNTAAACGQTFPSFRKEYGKNEARKDLVKACIEDGRQIPVCSWSQPLLSPALLGLKSTK
jgi:hypothetical protein